MFSTYQNFGAILFEAPDYAQRTIEKVQLRAKSQNHTSAQVKKTFSNQDGSRPFLHRREFRESNSRQKSNEHLDDETCLAEEDLLKTLQMMDLNMDREMD
jgi:hypothetical protein